MRRQSKSCEKILKFFFRLQWMSLFPYFMRTILSYKNNHRRQDKNIKLIVDQANNECIFRLYVPETTSVPAYFCPFFHSKCPNKITIFIFFISQIAYMYDSAAQWWWYHEITPQHTYINISLNCFYINACDSLYLYVSLDVQDETACDIHRHDFSAVSFFISWCPSIFIYCCILW